MAPRFVCIVYGVGEGILFGRWSSPAAARHRAGAALAAEAACEDTLTSLYRIANRNRGGATRRIPVGGATLSINVSHGDAELRSARFRGGGRRSHANLHLVGESEGGRAERRLA